MPLPRRRRTDFEEPPFEDPVHLRPFLDELPAAPGVYVFHGEEGDLPVYIGKSVNLRQRVLSHLRKLVADGVVSVGGDGRPSSQAEYRLR